MKDITYLALVASLIFILIPIWVSYRNHLGISKDIAVSAIRAYIQLTLIGYFITFVFSLEKWYLICLVIMFMSIIAARSCARRGKRFAKAFSISLISILGAECTSVFIWFLFDVVDFQGQYILPMSGMVIGSSMIVVCLTFERMLNEFKLTKELILAKLALGATPRQSSQELIENTVKAALIPNIESMKTTGLIQLPGMMTGAIIAGASPIVAVKYQVVILLTSLANTSIIAIIVCFLSYKLFFKQMMFDSV